MKESDIQKAMLEWLELKGILAFPVKNTGTYDPVRKCFRSFNGVKGIPDLTIIIEGKYIGAEVKNEKGRLGPEQKIMQGRIIEAGGYYIVVRSLEELETDIKEIKSELKNLQ